MHNPLTITWTKPTGPVTTKTTNHHNSHHHWHHHAYTSILPWVWSSRVARDGISFFFLTNFYRFLINSLTYVTYTMPKKISALAPSSHAHYIIIHASLSVVILFSLYAIFETVTRFLNSQILYDIILTDPLARGINLKRIIRPYYLSPSLDKTRDTFLFPCKNPSVIYFVYSNWCIISN